MQMLEYRLTWNKEYDIVSASSDDFSSLTGKTVVVSHGPKVLASIIATPIDRQYDYMLSANHVRYSIKW